MDKLRLNLGCGSVRPQGWVNIDSSWNAHLQKVPVVGKMIPKVFKSVQYGDTNVKYMNLNKKWDYANESVDVVYASHLFEHLTLKSAEKFLQESYRCLKPGGVIRLVVPDLYQICKKYITDFEAGHENPSEFIMWAINMHREGQYGQKLTWPKKFILEWQGYPHQHKFMYDKKSLSARLKEHGFVDILSKTYAVSDYIPGIKEVEGKEKEDYLSVYLEARKP